jgi:hypothetical protein
MTLKEKQKSKSGRAYKSSDSLSFFGEVQIAAIQFFKNSVTLTFISYPIFTKLREYKIRQTFSTILHNIVFSRK